MENTILSVLAGELEECLPYYHVDLHELDDHDLDGRQLWPGQNNYVISISAVTRHGWDEVIIIAITGERLRLMAISQHTDCRQMSIYYDLADPNFNDNLLNNIIEILNMHHGY